MKSHYSVDLYMFYCRSQSDYQAEYLFPFFYNMLPEGTNRQAVCKANRLDSDDYFGILMTTARYDTIGAIRVEKNKAEMKIEQCPGTLTEGFSTYIRTCLNRVFD